MIAAVAASRQPRSSWPERPPDVLDDRCRRVSRRHFVMCGSSRGWPARNDGDALDDLREYVRRARWRACARAPPPRRRRCPSSPSAAGELAENDSARATISSMFAVRASNTEMRSTSLKALRRSTLVMLLPGFALAPAIEIVEAAVRSCAAPRTACATASRPHGCSSVLTRATAPSGAISSSRRFSVASRSIQWKARAMVTRLSGASPIIEIE